MELYSTHIIYCFFFTILFFILVLPYLNFLRPRLVIMYWLIPQYNSISYSLNILSNESGQLILNSAFIIYIMFYCTLYLYGLVTVTNHTRQDGSYITICAYRMFLRLILTDPYRIHTHILGMLIAYRTKLLSPLSSKARASASWLTIPLFIFRLFPVCGSVLYCHYSKLFQYVKYLFVLPTLQTYSVFD